MSLSAMTGVVLKVHVVDMYGLHVRSCVMLGGWIKELCHGRQVDQRVVSC